jgi:hypothetical protein
MGFRFGDIATMMPVHHLGNAEDRVGWARTGRSPRSLRESKSGRSDRPLGVN